VIRVLAIDIDGVLTNGEVLLDEAGRESKSIFFRDIDAVFAARRSGLAVALVTGEDTPMVGVIARRLEVEHVYSGRKDKGEALAVVAADLGVALEEICYLGDADRDAPALQAAGLGLAPADSSDRAREAADRVLATAGGRGAVAEAVQLLLSADAPA
jgi:3-deoxy-D-manno-octulosonate 8-phosphate phosphatase (KDO 8-P phosphatase)